MKIIITIPAYNEERDIVRVINDIQKVMSETSYKYKILVLDDGSKDKTAELAKRQGAIVVSNKRNLGLAETFRNEMTECLKLKADIIVHTDADGQYPAKYIPLMINMIEKGNDIILGSRFVKGGYSGSLMKMIGNKAFAFAFSRLLKIKLTDTTTGFRAFTKEVAILPLINNFTYTQEQLIRASKSKMKIAEIPIKTYKTRESRLFRSSLDYAIKAWLNILRVYRDFEPIKFFGFLGLLLIIVGIFLGLWVFITLISTGNVGGIPRVILSALFIITGFQIVLFGFLADMNKK